MVEMCKKHDIAVSPFKALTSITTLPGGSLDKIVELIGNSHGCTSAQILLAWARQHTEGGPIITSVQLLHSSLIMAEKLSTASKEWQYRQILDSRDIILTNQEMGNIASAGIEQGNGGVDTLRDWDKW